MNVELLWASRWQESSQQCQRHAEEEHTLYNKSRAPPGSYAFPLDDDDDANIIIYSAFDEVTINGISISNTGRPFLQGG